MCDTSDSAVNVNSVVVQPVSPPLSISSQGFQFLETHNYLNSKIPSASLLDACLKQLQQAEDLHWTGMDYDRKTYTRRQSHQSAQLDLDDLEWTLYPTEVDPRLRITPTPSTSPDPDLLLCAALKSPPKAHQKAQRLGRHSSSNKAYRGVLDHKIKRRPQGGRKRDKFQLSSITQTTSQPCEIQKANPTIRRRNRELQAKRKTGNIHSMTTRSKSRVVSHT